MDQYSNKSLEDIEDNKDVDLALLKSLMDKNQPPEYYKGNE